MLALPDGDVTYWWACAAGQADAQRSGKPTSYFDVGPGHVIGAGEKAKILQDREIAIQAKALSDVAKLGAHLLPLFPCVYSFDGGMSAAWMREAAQHSHGRRLAGAIRPEKTKDRARLDCQREVLHGMDVTVTLAQMMKRDDWIIHFNLYCGADLNLQPWLIGQQVICHEC